MSEQKEHKAGEQGKVSFAKPIVHDISPPNYLLAYRNGVSLEIPYSYDIDLGDKVQLFWGTELTHEERLPKGGAETIITSGTVLSRFVAEGKASLTITYKVFRADQLMGTSAGYAVHLGPGAPV